MFPDPNCKFQERFLCEQGGAHCHGLHFLNSNDECTHHTCTHTVRFGHDWPVIWPLSQNQTKLKVWQQFLSTTRTSYDDSVHKTFRCLLQKVTDGLTGCIRSRPDVTATSLIPGLVIVLSPVPCQLPKLYLKVSAFGHLFALCFPRLSP